ncbi:MAG: helix-turn-helix transcriptional regulator [Acidobacteriia bacterium]|nr:helix-turn-helix transcriptional regulator [Terriglobia bacterium]
MNIGTRILQARTQKNLSQSELSRRSGIASSYLSRIENRRLEPRPKTLRKIADALGVPLAELFREGSAASSLHQCVVTLSGNCIMDLIRSRRNKRHAPPPGTEGYTPRQLQLLRMANYVIQNGNTRLLDTLDLLLSSLMSSGESRREAKGLVSPATHTFPPPGL